MTTVAPSLPRSCSARPRSTRSRRRPVSTSRRRQGAGPTGQRRPRHPGRRGWAAPAGGGVPPRVAGGARAAQLRRPTSMPAQPPEVAKVMRAFVVDGRLTQIPSAHGKRQVILDWLAQEFEPGVRYSESMVNLIIGQAPPRHCGVAPLPGRRRLSRSRRRRVLAIGWYHLTEVPRSVCVIDTHYDRLGIRPDAPADEVREAYRRLARQYHPGCPRRSRPHPTWRRSTPPGGRSPTPPGGRCTTPRCASPAAGSFTRSVPVDRLPEERYPVAPRPAASGAAPVPVRRHRRRSSVGAMVLGFVVSGVTDRGDPGDPAPSIRSCAKATAS